MNEFDPCERRHGWPASDRNTWPASNWNAWPASLESADKAQSGQVAGQIRPSRRRDAAHKATTMIVKNHGRVIEDLKA